MPKPRYALNTHVSPSNQALPCVLVINDNSCISRSTFRITPNCACDFPTTQSCTAHLPHVIRLASARCANHTVRHNNGDIVRVRPLGAPR